MAPLPRAHIRLADALLNERRLLAAAKVTLDGRPAKIGGIRNDFATVTSLYTGASFEWSWHAAAHIVEDCEGRFRS